MARATKFHGRIDGADNVCAVPGCAEPGEFRAPLSPGNFDGPGRWRLLCLDHVRQHNSAYNFFAGMTTEEITAAQHPAAGWERATRAFATGGADPGPAWADYADPLDAIAARFRPGTTRQRPGRFTAAEQAALDVLNLTDDASLKDVRTRYSDLARRYHPDRNGGDRRHEDRLRQVIDAWSTLRKARAFA